MVPQGGSCIIRAKDAALLQDRHHAVHEGVELTGKERRHDVEAVGRPGPEPAFQHVGDLRRRTDQEQVAARDADLKVVADCAGGTVSLVLPTLLGRIGVEVHTLNNRLDEVNQGYEDMMAGRNIRGVIIHEH